MKFKLIKDFPEYCISKEGIIISHNKILKGTNEKGYIRVGLTKNRKTYQKYVHRLVAENFIPNSQNKSQVNHVNGIKDDNRIENLEWVSRSENMTHCFKKLGFKGSNYKKNNGIKKKIYQYDMQENLIKIWNGLREAARDLSLYETNISKACKGKIKSTGGYIWRYVQ